MTYYRNYQDGGKVEPSEEWLKHLADREGSRGVSYFDTLENLTGGIGHLLTSQERGMYPEGSEIPEEIQQDWFRSDTAEAYNRAVNQAGEAGVENQKFIEGLASVNFQLGAGWRKKFPSAWKAILNKDYDAAAEQIRYKDPSNKRQGESEWMSQTPERAKDFIKAIKGLKNQETNSFADGGDVRGQSTDTVPAMLTPGEFVIRKDAADKIGPEKLQMLNNIDRLSNTALLENAKSPMGYQKGGLVGMLGDFISGQKENWARAKTMGEETGVRNPFLRTADEQLAQMQGAGTMPRGGWLEKKMPQAYAAGNPELEGPSKKEHEVESFREQPFMGVATTAEPKPEPEERKYSHDEQMKARSRIMTRAGGSPSLAKEAGVREFTLHGGKEGTGDIYDYLKARNPDVDYESEEFTTKAGGTNWKKAYKSLIETQVAEQEEAMQEYEAREKEASGYREEGLVRDPLGGEWVDPYEYYTPEARASMSGSTKAHQFFGQEHGWTMPTGGGHQDGGYINGYQNGGEVMNYQDGGQVKDVLSIFGEKSKQGDEIQKLMAMAAMQQMQRAQQVQQAIGMQGGGYADGYQQGGEVEPPMSGPESGPQEAPMPGGDQTYHQPAMEQLDMDQYEYASYVEHGPDMYKWMAPKYKSKQQWTPYDAMVDAGTIDPYEIDKDEINIVTNDQLEALSNQARESMRV